MAKRKQDDDIVIVGARRHPLRDAYHSILKMPWSALIAGIAAAFLLINAVFAVGYMITGGVVGVRAGVFRDAFFFSVQTMGTIGYGAMYPQSTAAHLVMVAESVVGLILTALSTGIVFARFSQTTGQLIFSDKVVISPMDGVPTLSFRIGNDRASTIFEATVRVSVIKTEVTKEGVTFYRLYDAKLTRDRTMALARSWAVMHIIDEASPLFGLTPADCRKDELELTVGVTGTDDTSLQPVHARRRYTMKDILWGARHADVLRELPDGRLELDVRKFNEVVPTAPTETFPYPKPTA